MPKNLIPNNNDLFNSTLNELKSEASLLSNTLDCTSEKIKSLEQSLAELNVNFPYSEYIHTEEVSDLKRPEAYHKESALSILYYFTKRKWLLSWEINDTSKCFRLYFTIEDIEYILLPYDEREIYKKTIYFKKPLIETKLEIRLSVARYIVPFMNGFKEELNKYRQSLSNSLEKPISN